MTCIDFVLVESTYPSVPSLIISRVPSFASSPDYLGLNSTERQLPGVVAAALTRYLGGLLRRLTQGPRDEASERQIEEVCEVLEAMAASGERQVLTLLEDEVFENLDVSPGEWTCIEGKLRPRSLAVLIHWRERGAE